MMKDRQTTVCAENRLTPPPAAHIKFMMHQQQRKHIVENRQLADILFVVYSLTAAGRKDLRIRSQFCKIPVVTVIFSSVLPVSAKSAHAGPVILFFVMEKMICRILLLIRLTSCVCGTFVVNVTQSSYQAEENQNITLEWTFTIKKETPLTSLYIYCETYVDRKALFHLHEGVEVPESQDEHFAGRVQFDKDVLREGRIRLHVSRLRTDDSGLYLCEVSTNYGVRYGECRLNVTVTLVLRCFLPQILTRVPDFSPASNLPATPLCLHSSTYRTAF
ncbi:hypothetical protein L3Q82_003890 [Scortum barcoo]|uniref:Uncharacterized protein n=1 Tax=Scortum barcoo TaxID=214431 RepID=A0ACB8X7R1_9TELE|nr:hypothetical protein L3Q82_003890 [Scortum barcoo]